MLSKFLIIADKINKEKRQVNNRKGQLAYF